VRDAAPVLTHRCAAMGRGNSSIFSFKNSAFNLVACCVAVKNKHGCACAPHSTLRLFSLPLSFKDTITVHRLIFSASFLFHFCYCRGWIMRLGGVSVRDAACCRASFFFGSDSMRFAFCTESIFFFFGCSVTRVRGGVELPHHGTLGADVMLAALLLLHPLLPALDAGALQFIFRKRGGGCE
jgi:hypothetical protein